MLRKARQVFVYNKTKETFLAFRVDIADSILSRLVGLLGRRSLKTGRWSVDRAGERDSHHWDAVHF